MEDNTLARYKERIAAKISEFEVKMFTDVTESEELKEELDSLITDLSDTIDDIEYEEDNSDEPANSEDDLMDDYRKIQGEM